MKKVFISIFLCILLVVIIATPALGAAQKLVLNPYPEQADTGSAFAIVNNSTGGVEATISLRKAMENAEYTAYLGIPFWDTMIWAPLGTFNTNWQGNGNFHINYKNVEPGDYLGLIIAVNRDGATRFWSDPFDLSIK
jgi:hypothetical protein